LEAVERARREPIAVIGIGCRFPGGVDTPEAFWKMLREGVDAVREVPAERWDIEAYYDAEPGRPGKMYTRHGAFLDSVDQFDAEFFGIAPREAILMDPQQRLLLEVTWEALERAGHSPADLRGSRTGVYVGVMGQDYAQLAIRPELIDVHTGTGNALSVIAGRLSYDLGLQGPAITVDTACSSSLVTIHLACQSLRAQESEMAIVGGVNLILSPIPSLIECAAHMLSPDGRCRAFDAAANGFVRGEGCGVVVLKRLSDAQADGDSILALVRGSAINHDGRSGGLSVPNELAQESLIRQALAQADVQPSRIQYVEAHGTGTSLGDPIEMGALASVVLANNSRTQPLLVGSVKTNIGHLEGAAGIAGLIKTVLALRHGEIPPNLHFREPNPHIPWDSLPVRVPTELEAWPATDASRLAGVSSFGISGTNAHVILEECSKQHTCKATPPPRWNFLTVSARTPQSLNHAARRLGEHLVAYPDLPLEAVCFTANVGRMHFNHRLCLSADSTLEMGERLTQFALEGTLVSGIAGHIRQVGQRRTAFVFQGEARKVLEVARECHAVLPAFRQIIDHHLGALEACEPQVRSNDWMSAQEVEPATVYLLEIALAALWRSWGIEPSGVAGTGTGEYAAASIAGIFSMADGLKWICRNPSRPGEDEVAGLQWQPPRLTFVPAWEGAQANAPLPCWQNIGGRTVSRDEQLRRLCELGFECLLEPGRATASWRVPTESQRSTAGTAANSNVRERIFRSVADLYVAGLPLNWSRFYDGTRPQRLSLPTYPFQRRRYWIEGATFSGETSAAHEAEVSAGRHPLLGRRRYSAAHKGHIEFEGEIGVAAPAFLAEHRVFQQPVPPASLYVEMALAAGGEVNGSEPVLLENFAIQQPLILSKSARRTVHVLLTPAGEHAYHCEVFSRNMLDDQGAAWTRHANCLIRRQAASSTPARRSLKRLRDLCAEEVQIDAFYHAYDRLGIHFGPSFRALERVWRATQLGGGKALGRIRLPSAVAAAARTYQVHPVLLDAACQVIGAAFPDAAGESTYLMSGYERIVVFGPLDPVMWSQVELQPAAVAQPRLWSGNLFLLSEAGDVRMAVEGFQLFRADADSLFAAAPEWLRGQLYQVRWRALPRHAQPSLAAGVPTVGELDVQLQPCLASWLALPEIAAYEDVLREFESLSAAYIARALRDLGCPLTPGARFDGQTLARQLGVQPRYRRLWMRLLEVMSEEGVLRANGEHWEVVRTVQDRDPAEICSRLAARVAEIAPITDLLDRCARDLTAVLRGTSDPQQLLFPGGDFSQAAALYRENPGARMMNTLVREAIVSVVKNVPVGRTLRILELGAGTGGTTAFILPSLPTHGTRYLFTDLSPFFTARAQETFGDYPFVDFRTLNIEQSPREQGFEREQFDLVIAANVLHATKDLRQTLRHVRETMLPGGLLLLLEVSGRQRWLDLTFGYTEGWWRFSDHELRPSYPLLAAAEWQKLLEECGFVETARLAAGPDRGPLSQQALILGRTPSAQNAASARAGSPAWLIFGDSSGLGHRLAEQLWGEGSSCTLAVAGDSYRALSAGIYELDASDPEHVASLLRAIASHSDDCHVVILGGTDGAPQHRSTSDLRAAVEAPMACVLNVIQAFARANHAPRPQFYLVTRGVHAIDEDDAVCVSQAPLWGLGKVIALEHPQWWGGLVDLPSEPCADDAAFVFGEIREGDGEDQVAYRSGTRFVARLAPCEMEKPAALQLQRDATYLITGGLGVLGLRVARWMVQRGARQLYLVGRTPPTPQARAAIAELTSAGAAITIGQADVADEDQVRALLNRIDGTPAPLRGVIHAAGVGRFDLLQDMQPAALVSVLRPKVYGAWVLDRLTRDRPLDFFVSFSSMISIWGARGMGHYAAANHFLDTLCQWRRRGGRPALTLNWGPWSGGGMLPAEAQEGIARMGMASLTPDRAIEALEYLMRSQLSQAIVANVDWGIYKTVHETRGRRRLFDEVSTPAATCAVGTAVSSQWQYRLAEAALEERPARVREIVREALAGVLRVDDATALDANRGLFDMGMDSLMAVELKKQLESGLRLSLSSTLVFDHPTINSLATHLVSELGWAEQAPAAAAASAPAADFLAQVHHIPDDALDASIEEDLQKLEGLLRNG